MKTISKGAIGEAGEYFVACQATLRGWTANMMRHNHNGADILLSKEQNGLKTRGLQVKTSLRKSSWRLSKKDEGPRHSFCPTFFYAFVYLNSEGRFNTEFIVPASFVAERIAAGHKAWVAAGGKDSDIRQLKASDIPEEYKEAWHLLE